VGIGRIGALVARRAYAFGMRLVAYDPFVSEERARALNVEMLSLDRVMAESDFVTVHLPKTKETTGLIGREYFAIAKPNLRIINVARGGIVDEAALAEAIESGQIAGAALDVFSTEPMTDSPLFKLDSVVVTPHLGASTTEAQDKAGETIAQQVKLALANDFVPFAVNVSAAEAPELMKPYLPLADRLGTLFTSLVGTLPSEVEVSIAGELAGYDTRILTLSVMKGLFTPVHPDPVTFVNAPQLAAEHKVEIRETKSESAVDFANVITIRGRGHEIAGTLSGRSDHPRIVSIDGYGCDVPPSSHMLVVQNHDQPGMIGVVGVALGNAGVNIADMDVARQGATALMVIATEMAVPDSVLEDLRARPEIVSVRAIRG
jgi:D-3-phosphoglycerate dehydrogenase / 2-oxoglutarate reductase